MTEKILVVDDEIETLRLVGLTLQRQGFQIITASDGAQGLAMAKSEHPDVIILDIMMPDMDGFAVTRQLRTGAETSEIPILMFSARTQLDDKVTGYEAGVDDYVTKPIHPSELVEHVKSLLNRSKQRSTTSKTKSYNIALIATKGGVGTSTLALNLAYSLKKTALKEVSAVEMNPGHGSWYVGQERIHSEGLNTLLRLRPEEITVNAVKEEMYRTDEGINFLLTSHRIKDIELMRATSQIESIIQQFNTISQVTLLDMGTVFWMNYAKIFGFCQEVVIVTESYLPVLNGTFTFMEELKSFDFGVKKPIKVVAVDSLDCEHSFSLSRIQEILDHQDVYQIPAISRDFGQVEDGERISGYITPQSMPVEQVNRLAQEIASRISVPS